MSKNTVPHRLIDEDGDDVRASVLFASDIYWQPGEIVTLSPQERYRVLERRGGDPVTLVVERAALEPPQRLDTARLCHLPRVATASAALSVEVLQGRFDSTVAAPADGTVPRAAA